MNLQYKYCLHGEVESRDDDDRIDDARLWVLQQVGGQRLVKSEHKFLIEFKYPYQAIAARDQLRQDLGPEAIFFLNAEDNPEWKDSDEEDSSQYKYYLHGEVGSHNDYIDDARLWTLQQIGGRLNLKSEYKFLIEFKDPDQAIAARGQLRQYLGPQAIFFLNAEDDPRWGDFPEEEGVVTPNATQRG